MNEQRLAKYRTPVQVVFDLACWAVAITAATWLRYDFAVGRIHWGGILRVLPFVVGAQVVAGVLLGMYRGRWRFGSFDEVMALTAAAVTTSAFAFAVNNALPSQPLPRSVPIGAGLFGFVLMGAGRYAWRLSDERRRRPNGEQCQRLLVFGAGDGGVKVIRALLGNPSSHYLPVAILDDDPKKRHLRVMKVPVVGNRARLEEAAREHKADALLIAIPSAGASLVTELSEMATECRLPVKVLPPVDELIDGKVGVGDIRDVTPADLLGRHEIHTDLGSIAGYLTNRRVLVTGAGGSIGSELCRQIYRFAPAELVMVDRDESALHAVQLSIEGRALLDSPDLVLLDLRDRGAVEKLIASRRPEVIFHAAALKHLPLLERYPAEAVKTNVWATLDLLEIAAAHGVDRFVNISTDKAADPCSVLGYSKRITERLTSFVSADDGMVGLSVRFGNVLGSRGSVLSTFHAQIERGGPITVTDPDVTRYFMTIEEAVELVIQAGAIGGPGEVLVLDMGEPVRIADVAQVLAARANRPVSIQYTGLRGGEKLHEVLLGGGEEDQRPMHPLISHVAAAPLDPRLARSIDIYAHPRVVVTSLAKICAEGAQVPADG